MTEPRATSDPAGRAIHALGAILLCAAVGAVALWVKFDRPDIAGLYAIAAAVVFAGLALSDALCRRR